MRKIRTIIFCGHQSPYGFAHLGPLLTNHFQIVKVILAPSARWRSFEKKLLKQKNQIHFSAIEGIRLFAKFLRMSVCTGLTIRLLRKYSTPYWFLDDVNSPQAIRRIQSLQPELFFCAAYPQIFSHGLLSIPLKGAINSHPSLLPKYRGAHPHFWVLVNGETETGLTAHYMTDQIDDGEIIGQISFHIKDDDTYTTLYQKILNHVPELIKHVENFMVDNQGHSWPQNSKNATFYNNDKESDRKILWDIYEGKKIYNLVRTERAYFVFRSKKFIVKKISLATNHSGPGVIDDVESGTIVDIQPDIIVVKAKDCYINLYQVRADFLNLNAMSFTGKYRLKIGQKFE